MGAYSIAPLPTVGPTLPPSVDATLPPTVGPTLLQSYSERLKSALWAFVQVEYNGFYSLEKLCAFQISKKRPRLRQVVTLVIATLPTVLIVFALELFILEDPTLGWKQNPTFFIRETIRAWFISIAGNLQIQEIIPKLRQPWSLLLLVSFLQIVPYTATLMCVAEGFDVFPVPFSNLMPILPVMVVAILIRYYFVRHILEQHPDVKPEHQRMEQLTGFVFSILILYSVYAFAFRRVDMQFQIVLSFVLYGIKYGVKHRMWKLSHVQAHHDLSIESGACGAHFFHALFSTACLQSARSFATLVIVLLLSVAQDVFALHSIWRKSQEVSVVKQSFENDMSAGAVCDPFSAEWTATLLKDASRVRSERERKRRFSDSPIMASRSASFTHQLAAWGSADNIQKVGPPRMGSNVGVTQRKAAVTHAVAHLMHCREVVLLHMFVDIFVPLFYLAYVALLLYLPKSNRQYFESLADMGDDDFLRLTLKIAILVGCKLLALAAMCALLRSRRQPSGLHQLAFVVSSQRWTMQPWFVLSVLQIINFPLVHMGNDLTFQFKWITHHPRGDPM